MESLIAYISWKTQYCHESIITLLICRFSPIPTGKLYCRIWKLASKIPGEAWGIQNSPNNFEKKNKVGDRTVPEFSIYGKVSNWDNM